MPLKNRFFFQKGGRLISSSAFCELQKTVTRISLVFIVSFSTISKAFQMAHNSASRISLFFPRKKLFSFHWSRSVSFQQTAAPVFPWSSLDASVHITRPVRYLVASSHACFLHFTIISPWNWNFGFIFSTGSAPSAGSIECWMVICQATQCP